MSPYNIGFYEDLTKISFSYHQISSNTHLIFSSGDIGTFFSLVYFLLPKYLAIKNVFIFTAASVLPCVGRIYH